ncbi:MAG TPA: hypothetical protein VHF22_13310 [Planctomycetota bacterium]|nr:hypothetical protein [Planctomycetota bacterium]
MPENADDSRASTPPAGAPVERKRPFYKDLRPRRAVRRWSLVGIAVALLGVLVWEALWMARHGLT